jgi:16S rRNA (cytidine1402-2'-O)-methyltransferase
MADPSPSVSVANGTLYVVATPLGNLDDLSSRARNTLENVEMIACEDTRRTSRLLARYGIRKPTVSCHRFNESERREPILQALSAGRDVALVSDGGTPAISDPGAALVDAVLSMGISVRPIPGPSAPVALLSVSGFRADRFVFDGFLPARGAERRRRLRTLAAETRTIVLLETPHRIRASLRDIAAVFGPRRIAIGRELTKIHEHVLRGPAEAVDAALEDDAIRGEFTIAIEPTGDALATRDGGDTADRERTVAAWTRALAREDGDKRRALRFAARELGVGRAELRRKLDELDAD